MIGRRSKRDRDRDSPETTDDQAGSGPLFDLEELYERRIQKWSPVPDDELAPDTSEPPEADPAPGSRDDHRPRRPAPAASPARPPEAPEPEVPETPRVPEAADARRAVAQPEPGRKPRPRGRPRGRPRRQVHFHVDPDEERLLMEAVELYGSQQKGLVAALHALKEAEHLRRELERLRAECERQRELLAQAESLFNR